MKNFLKIATIFATYYLIGSFVAWDFNVSHWSWVGRLACLTFAFVSAGKLTD